MTRAILSLLIVSAAFIRAGERDGKLKEPVEDNQGHFVFKGNRYKVFTSKLKWEEAQAACKKLGGHLVRIESKEENDFIFKIITKKKYHGKSFWIDLTDAKKEGRWIRGDGVKPTYVNWGGGQPDNYNGAEHHARIRSTENKYYQGRMVVKAGTWEDWANHPYPYICEWESKKDKKKIGKPCVVAGNSNGLRGIYANFNHKKER